MKKHKTPLSLKNVMRLIFLVALVVGSLSFVEMVMPTGTAHAAVRLCDNNSTVAKCASAPYYCGGSNDRVSMSIDIGCKGQGNALTDAVFAIIRFLSIGVGIVITASTVYAGVQYSMARDDPSQVGMAKSRIMNNLAALLIYIFAYAILNYVIPGQFLK